MSDSTAAARFRDARSEQATAFDFLAGSWHVHNRKLRDRLAGSTTWDEFEATYDVEQILGGIANLGHFRVPERTFFEGMSLRLYQRTNDYWMIYWVDSNSGELMQPLAGRFVGDVGTFVGENTWKGKPVMARFTWHRHASSPRWEQAYSADGGASWETNWVMEFKRRTEH